MVAPAINKIKLFLSLKVVTTLIVILAIGSRIIQLISLFNIRADRVQQMLATQNFVSGHGISTAWVFPGKLSQVIYEPLIKWPPGYSLLLAPFYLIFNKDYLLAGLALDIVAAVMLIFVSRAILKILDIPIFLVNLYTFLTTFFIYSFYSKPSSDAIAITFFVGAFYFTLLLLKSGTHWVKKTGGIIFLLFMCASIKYLFIPVVFVIPLFLVWKGIADKRLEVKKAGIYSLLILAFSLAALLAYQKLISGSATYIASPERGLFLPHLLAAFPFIPASFIKLDTIGLIFTPWIEHLVFRFFQCLHLLLLFFCLFWVFQVLVKKKIKQLSLADSFFFLAFFTSLTITIVLIILSVSVAREVTEQGGFWTYVEEPRYYGLPCVLIHLGVFVFYQNYQRSSSRYFKIIFFALIIFLLPEFFRGVYFESRRIMNFKKEKYSWQMELEVQKFADEIIKKALQKQPAENIIVAGSSTYINNRVSLYSHIPILKDVYKINDLATLNTKKKVLILIILREDALPDFQRFISMKEKEIAGHINIFSFYTVYVSPH